MNADNKVKKCYIYTRVSTAMQTDGYSLDAQERRMQDIPTRAEAEKASRVDLSS